MASWECTLVKFLLHWSNNITNLLKKQQQINQQEFLYLEKNLWYANIDGDRYKVMVLRLECKCVPLSIPP